MTKRITVNTNDRDNAAVNLECEVNVLSAMRLTPATVNLGQIKRDAAEQKSIVKITRGDAGPLKPKVVSTGNPSIAAELREVTTGEEYELEITLKPPWPSGALRGNVKLETGVEEAPEESVAVYATIAARLQASPQRLMLRPDPEKETRAVARLNWDGEPKGNVLETKTDDPRLSVRLEEQKGQQMVVVDVPPGYEIPKGQVRNVVVTTDDPQVPTLQIPVFVVSAPVASEAQPAGQPGATPVKPGVLKPRARAEAAPAGAPTPSPVSTQPTGAEPLQAKE